MSSPVKKSERIQRGILEDVSDLPDHIQAAAQAVADEFGWCVIRGSYYRGNWDVLSDLDLGIPVLRLESREWATQMSSSLGVKLDIGYVQSATSAPGMLVLGEVEDE